MPAKEEWEEKFRRWKEEKRKEFNELGSQKRAEEIWEESSKNESEKESIEKTFDDSSEPKP